MLCASVLLIAALQQPVGGLATVAQRTAAHEAAFWQRVDPVLDAARSDRLRSFAAAHWDHRAGLPSSSVAAPQQRVDVPFPGLTATPWHDASDYGWAAALEHAAAEVDAELGAYLDAEHQGDIWRTSKTNLLADTSSFSRLVLRERGDDPATATRVGREAFPRTLAAFESAPLAPRPLAINKQAAGSGLGIHTDNANFVLACHLGLRGCAGAAFTVAGETRHWRRGKLLIADTSFLHSTSNDSREDRYVASCAVWHPDLTPRERSGVVALHAALRDLDDHKKRH